MLNKIHSSLLTSALVALYLLNEANGIPLPLREGQPFGVPRPEQVPIQRGNPYGSQEPHSRFRRNSEERPVINKYQGQPPPVRTDHIRHSNGQNEHGHRDQNNQFGSRNQQTQQQYQQPQPLQSNLDKNNKHQRDRRETQHRAPLNEWQIQPNGQPSPNSHNGLRDGHCTSADCMAKLASNNIRNEQSNGFSSHKIPNPHPNLYIPNNDQVQLPQPVLHLIPPPETPENDQNVRNFQEFYGPQYGLPVETRNYPNNVPAAHTSQDTSNFSEDTHNASTDTNLLTIKTSSIAIGDSFEIVRIELDLSEGEDNEETNLEVEDQ